MLRRFSVNYAVLTMALDTGVTFLALSLAASLRPHLPRVPLLVPLAEIVLPTWIYILVPLIWFLAFLVASVYDPKHTYRLVDEMQAVSLGSIFAALLCAGLFFLTFREFSRWLFFTFLVINVTFLISWRLIARLLWRLSNAPAANRRVLIVGAGNLGNRVAQMIEEHKWTGLSFIGYLDDMSEESGPPDVKVLGNIDDARRVVQEKQINDVVITLPQNAYRKVNDLVLEMRDLPVLMRVVPDYYSLSLYQASVEDFAGVPMINLRDPALNPVQRLIKRTFDLIIGGIVTLLISPLLAIVALAIRLDSEGPVIFRQQRVGENGRLFAMYKFRSMIVGAEELQEEQETYDEHGNLLFKREDDPRVTRVGRFIRRTSLDELPQLFNVLQGTMSLVGPRPELPMMVGRYELWQHKRFAVPQGMTGWWQINGRADKPLHLHTEDDIYYIQNYSLLMDIYILLKTPWVVLRGKGAY
ncbi:MAG: sugar transferase [Candidatus Promineifilaceae bacterium]|nr:sugar transferase [Candidatus Promineifilaceae bacterium]